MNAKFDGIFDRLKTLIDVNHSLNLLIKYKLA